MSEPKYCFFNERPLCPKCLTPEPNKTFCSKGCWDGLSFREAGTEHLHWFCNCLFKWMSPTADHKEPEGLKDLFAWLPMRKN